MTFTTRKSPDQIPIVLPRTILENSLRDIERKMENLRLEPSDDRDHERLARMQGWNELATRIRTALEAGEDPPQPTMGELRTVRDRLDKDQSELTLLIERIAALEASACGFPSLADSDNPETHRIFAKRVVTVIAELAG